jgi:hypothetical protein
VIKNLFSRITDSFDLLIGAILGSFFTLIIGLFIPQIVIAEIAWGIAFVFIMFLLFSHH